MGLVSSSGLSGLPLTGWKWVLLAGVMLGAMIVLASFGVAVLAAKLSKRGVRLACSSA